LENKEQVNPEIGAEVIESPVCETENIESVKEEETSLGKFRDSEALLKAYNSLQAEFTRKSQRLKELENKEDSDKAEAPDSSPVYLSADWQKQVQEFIIKNPIGEKYREEIAGEIMKDEALARDKQCLKIALDRVLASKYRQPEELLGDENFINNFVTNNEKVREKIIGEYLESLNLHKSPDVIKKKGDIPLSPVTRPKTIKEAGEMAAKLLIRR